MTRVRWAGFLAVLLFALGAGLPALDAVDRQAAVVAPAPADDGSGSWAAGAGGWRQVLTAVEPGRTILARSESRLASWAASFALVAVGLLVAAAGGQRLRRRRLLELSIRTRGEWWRPAPGRRAPPGLSAP